MRMVFTAMGCGMRLGKALKGKEQGCHEDHKGLYERVLRHRRSVIS